MNEVNIFLEIMSADEIEEKRNDAVIRIKKIHSLKRMCVRVGWFCFIGIWLAAIFINNVDMDAYTQPSFGAILGVLSVSVIGMIVMTENARLPLLFYFAVMSIFLLVIGVLTSQGKPADLNIYVIAIAVFCVFGGFFVKAQSKLDNLSELAESLEYTQEYDSFMIRMWTYHPQVKRFVEQIKKKNRPIVKGEMRFLEKLVSTGLSSTMLKKSHYDLYGFGIAEREAGI